MDDDTISLGTERTTWAIKDFSVVLRQQIIHASRQQPNCTVADWLHGYFQRHGINGQQFAPVQIARVEPKVEQDRLIAMAALDLPQWLRRRVHRLLGETLGVEPPPPPKRLSITRTETAQLAAPQAAEPCEISELVTAA